MTNTSEKGTALILIIVVIIVILIGAFAFKKMKQTPSAVMNNQGAPTNNVANTPLPVVTVGPSSLNKGASNADLDQDLQTISGKMNSVNSTSTDVDTSIQNQSADSGSNLQ